MSGYAASVSVRDNQDKYIADLQKQSRWAATAVGLSVLAQANYLRLCTSYHLPGTSPKLQDNALRILMVSTDTIGTLHTKVNLQRSVDGNLRIQHGIGLRKCRCATTGRSEPSGGPPLASGTVLDDDHLGPSPHPQPPA
jgi:hypothetical protein